MKNNDTERLLREKITQALSKIPQETIINRVSGGVGSGKIHDQSLLNLHNYRLIYDFERNDKLLLPFIKPDHKGSGAITVRLVNSNSTYEVKGFEDSLIYVKRKTIEIRYKPISEQWQLINHGEKGADEYLKITRKMNIKGQEIVKAFIQRFGGSSELTLMNIYIHNKFIDATTEKIPKRLKFGNNIVQKQYNEHNVEFLSPTAAMNYLSTEGVKELVPTLDAAMNRLADNIMIVQPLRALKLLCKKPEEILQYSKYVNMLTEHERRMLTEHFFLCACLEVNGDV